MRTPESPDTADTVIQNLRDRLTTLRNAVEIIRLSTSGEQPVVVFALRMIEQQLAHLSEVADELDNSGLVDLNGSAN